MVICDKSEKHSRTEGRITQLQESFQIRRIMNPASLCSLIRHFPTSGQETQRLMGKRHRSGFTHQVVQHPHEGLELCLARFPLDVTVQRHPSLTHALAQGFKPLLVQEHQVVHAAGAAQSTDLDKREHKQSWLFRV